MPKVGNFWTAESFRGLYYPAIYGEDTVTKKR